ncbi:dTDP-4-dehydrorhamnose 3,5-epimerase [Formosa sp. Hel1_31_208]|uniref:dTDP-4-dehydrorhamnose 3,5-epimerase n=1 Tax=Formosa sp. Hel1_31_208 TaxID=1798225 RepID=UPI00087BEE94|nr:dTDP-4-dehydrorhamnose 3,5-epimerase [Formosa sp. Hel1_31_208]SDR74786.1 dTDP-4-dehydrorhamnose 3,5-epimerase [Formosa sp. Hel1_31_208]
MIAQETKLKDCYILTPKIIEDERGYFFESFNKKNFQQLTDLDIDWVQDNQSKSQKGVLRGLHFQIGAFEQAKLIRAVKGSVLDICVDLRVKSETFGEYVAIELSETNNKQVFLPRGFAHGFLVLEDDTIINYKCDNYYNKNSERGIQFNDKQIDIDWNFPQKDVVLSEKDKALPTLSEYLNGV